MSELKFSEVDVLIMKLKSGEYDGTDLMKAWLKLRELDQLNKKYKSDVKRDLIEAINNIEKYNHVLVLTDSAIYELTDVINKVMG